MLSMSKLECLDFHLRAPSLCSLANYTTLSYGPPCYMFVPPPNFACSLVLRDQSQHVFLLLAAYSFVSTTIKFCNHICSVVFDCNWDLISFLWSWFLPNLSMVRPPLIFPISSVSNSVSSINRDTFHNYLSFACSTHDSAFNGYPFSNGLFLSVFRPEGVLNQRVKCYVSLSWMVMQGEHTGVYPGSGKRRPYVQRRWERFVFPCTEVLA
jgi:hypothetical protein